MKNKKIILGLGTITALGAMSMGFVACKKTTDDAGLKERLDLIEAHLNKDGSLFKTKVEKFLEKPSGDNAKDPKNVGELKNGATVKDLIDAVKKIKGFSDEFDIMSNDKDKKGETANGAALTGTSHTLTIVKKGETDKTTKFQKDISFEFTIKSSS